MTHSEVHVETEFGVVSLILFIKFSFVIFEIFQFSSVCETWLNAFLRHFSLCGTLSERLFSCNSENITADHVRDHSTAIICFVPKFNGPCFDVGCHVFRNRQRII